MFKFLTLFFILSGTSTALAYPDFIAYGYRSCLTCHWSGDGGGGLNDYGRAVWASEITSKSIFHRNTSDEKMGENSGFFGSKPLPWWIRPGIKYRGLHYYADPGSARKLERWINMQGDLNFAIPLDQDQKILTYFSYGYRPIPAKYEGVQKKPDEWISREHWVRWQAKENFFLYAGSMDKVFGIKNVDHTAYSRELTRTTMDDQVHGVKGHVVNDNYDLFGMVFLGNLSQEEELREKGVSFQFEKSWKEKAAWGVSAMSTSNKYLTKNAVSAQVRLGLREQGNGFLGEIGLVDDKRKGAKAVQGYYTMIQNMIKIRRGYHFTAQFENFKPDISTDESESYRYGVGLLAFPWARTEIRIQLLNYRTLVPGQASPDTWTVLSQIHLSL